MVYFELMFIKVKGMGIDHLFAHIYLHTLIIFVIKIIFSLLNYLCTFVKKNQLITCLWIYFWALHSLPRFHINFRIGILISTKTS